MTASLEAALRAEPARFEPASPEAKEELREVTELYQAVVSGVVQATFTNRFPSKVSGFEYSVGDLGPLLDAQQLDGVVLAFGTGAASSGGRKAVQTLSAIFAGVASSGVDRLLVGLFDRRGDLLWFGIFASTGYDLRDPDSAAHFVEVLTGDLPAVKR